MQSHSAAGGHDRRRRCLLRQVRTAVDALFVQARDATAVEQLDGDDDDGGGNGDTDGLKSVRQQRQLLRTAADVLSLHNAVEPIFMHGLRLEEAVKDDKQPSNCWQFVDALNRLNPPTGTTTASTNIGCPTARIRNNRSLRWIYDVLATGQLSARLIILLSDEEHVHNCYAEWAFMRCTLHVRALLLCLRAVENSRPEMMAFVDNDTVQCADGDNSVIAPTTASAANDAPDTGLARTMSIDGTARVGNASQRTWLRRRYQSLPDIDSEPLAVRDRVIAEKTDIVDAIDNANDDNNDDLHRVPSFTYKPPTPSSTPTATFSVVDQQPTTKTPTISPPTPPSSSSASSSATKSTPPGITLLCCDDIEIHFDRNHSARQTEVQRRVAGITPTTTPTTPSIPILSTSTTTTSIAPQRPTPPPSILYSWLPLLGKSLDSQPTAAASTESVSSSTSSPSSVSPPTVTAAMSLSSSLYATLLAPSEFVNAFVARDGHKPNERCSLSSLSSPPPPPPPPELGDDHYEVCADASEVADTPSSRSGTSIANARTIADLRTHSCPDVLDRQRRRASQQQQQSNGESPASQQQRSNTISQANRRGCRTVASELSLTRFLQWARFSSANSDLERENAHFSLSEAMISAIEQMKSRKLLERLDGERGRSEAEEAAAGSGQRDQTTMRGLPPKYGGARNTNDRYIRTVLSGSSASSSASSFGSPRSYSTTHQPPTRDPQSNQHLIRQPHVSSASSSEPYSSSPDEHRQTQPNRSSASLQQQHQQHQSTALALAAAATADDNSATGTGASDDDAACRAYAEWGTTRADTWSAESVALSLIAKFSDQQLPRATDLLWLVSEQDAPQKLLPLPSSWTVNPDEPYQIPFTRGTRDWAPPRAQVIFTPHPKLSRAALMLRQNQRCAGCGMRVAAAYAHRFRYCEYVGRYHCTNCHRNQIAVIPALVLHGWDFGCRPVSVFAYRLLEQIAAVPVFRVAQINEPLYGRVRQLRVARQRRGELQAVRDFVEACRFAGADGTRAIFEETVAEHICDNLEAWSMSDFLAVRAGTFGRDIVAVIERCERHVMRCELCRARGFVCALCERKEVIFPWQAKVRRCEVCGVCVHAQCWTVAECARCERLWRHRLARQRSVVGEAKTMTTTTTTTTMTEESGETD